MRRRRCREDGVSAVEFGLVLPFLLALLLGLMDYGYVYFVQLTLTNAAREGARVGVTKDEGGVAQTSAQSAAAAYLAASGLSANVVATDPTATNTVQVTITVNPFQPLVGFVPTPNQLSGQAAMRWELAP